MEGKMNLLKKTARSAGILYVMMDVCLIFSGMYVDPKLYVPGDAVSTVSNILASEWHSSSGNGYVWRVTNFPLAFD